MMCAYGGFDEFVTVPGKLTQETVDSILDRRHRIYSWMYARSISIRKVTMLFSSVETEISVRYELPPNPVVPGQKIDWNEYVLALVDGKAVRVKKGT